MKTIKILKLATVAVLIPSAAVAGEFDPLGGLSLAESLAAAGEAVPAADSVDIPARAAALPEIEAEDVATRPEDAEQVRVEGRPETSGDKRLAESEISRAAVDYGALILSAANAKEPRDIFVRSRAGLLTSRIHLPREGGNFNLCVAKPTILAFAYPGRPDIYVCARMVDNPKVTLKYMAQTLIHEAVHVAGIRNECEATGVEIAAMRLGAGGVAYYNGYTAGCGF